MIAYICFSLVLALIAVLVIYRDRRSLASALTLSIFFASLYVGLILYLVQQGTAGQELALKWLRWLIIWPLLAFALLSFVLIANGFYLIYREGFAWTFLQNSLLGLANMLLILCASASLHRALFSQGLERILWEGLLLGLIMIYSAAMFGLLSLLIYSQIYRLLPKEAGPEYIMILGCGLRRDGSLSPLLRQRVDKAFKIWERLERQAVLLPSGGKGADELCSEAEAMARYLLGRGVPAEKLLLEAQSRNTEENFAMAKVLMDQREAGRSYELLFVSSNYHIFRAGLISRDLGLVADGIGSRTAAYYWPTAMLREFVAILVRHRRYALAYLSFVVFVVLLFFFLRSALLVSAL